MLELHNLLWVVPGLIFVNTYNNQTRGLDSINLSGWPYIFILVLAAVPTWYPSQMMASILLSSPEVDVSGDDQRMLMSGREFMQNFIALVCSSALATGLARLLVAWHWLKKFIVPLSTDAFINYCRQLEGALVMLALKNDKVYIGILKKYPENTSDRHELQSIFIRPVVSGYRVRETKKLIFNTSYYEKKTDDSHPMTPIASIDVAIPRSEIVTLGPFDKKIFNHPSNKN